MFQFIMFETHVEPKFIIENQNIYKIKKMTNDWFKVTKFIIILKENIIHQIIIDGDHPNCNPDNQVFCKTRLHGTEFNDSTKNELEDIFSFYNFDSCFYKPWEYIIWETTPM